MKDLKIHCRIVFATVMTMALAGSVSAKDFLVYFGTYTNALSQGIYVSHLDSASGILSEPVLAVATPSPCWVTISRDERYLYAANSVPSFGGEKTGEVSAFAIDAKTGALTLLNEKPSGGAGPCCTSVDPSGKVLLIANYNGGTVKSYQLDGDGSIGADGSMIPHVGHGSNASRQTSPHAHYITTDPTGHYALACDLGIDKVVVYGLSASNAALELKSDFTTPTVPPGSGARHLSFSRDGKFIHVVNEMACTVTTLAWGAKKGTLEAVETVSALPTSIPRQNTFTAAEILTHPSGKYVYVTVRGADIVSVFKADARSGKLTWLQSIDSGGQVPRGLGIDPTGRWLITGNQKSNIAAEYSIDAKTGLLNATGRQLKIGAPVDVKFIRAK